LSIDTEVNAEANAPQATTNGPSIKLKASLAPMTALEISNFDPKKFNFTKIKPGEVSASFIHKSTMYHTYYE